MKTAGLPTNPSDIVAKEVAIKPIEVDLLLETFQKQIWNKEIKAYDGVIDLWDLEDVLIFMMDNCSISFGEWKHQFIVIPEENGDHLHFEIRSIHNSIEAEILWVEDLFNDLRHYPTGSWELSGFFEDYVEHFEHLLLEANKRIISWNQVCSNYKPIIYEKPPIEDFKNMLFDNFFDMVVMEEFQYVRHDFNDDLNAFLEDSIFYPIHLHHSINNEYISFGSFNLRFQIEQLEEIILVRLVLDFDGLGCEMILVEEEFSPWVDCFTVGEFEVIIDTIIEHGVDAIIQWNEFLVGGENSERNNRKANRITG